MAHVLIVEARFYSHLNDMLLDGVRHALDAEGNSHETVTVPGALEVPAAISLAADTGRYDAYVALGVVIRSEEHTSELQSLMRCSYAVSCLRKKKKERYR